MGKIGNFRKKKNIVFVSCAAVLVLIGGTISYHSSRGFFTNLFHLGYWQNETVEDFTGPDNWSTCEEVPKTVIGRNTGNMPAIARLKYEEYWKAAGSTSTDHTTELSLVDGDNDPIVSVNLQNEIDWVDGGDGWYYYRYILQPGDETTSLLKSVTLNCKNNFAGENSVCTTEGDTISCTKPDNPYDGAKYHVFVTVQYIEEDGCQDIWGHCAEERHIVNCNDGDLLYDEIACKSKGLDTSFTRIANTSESIYGVYTYDESARENYPVQYFRGDVSDNFVVWGDKCWQIVRTTTTGGVKMIYHSEAYPDASNSEHWFCTNDPSGITYNGENKFKYNNESSSPSDVGYMYGERYPMMVLPLNNISSLRYGNDVSWDGTNYTLTNVIIGDWKDRTFRSRAANGHFYFCLDGSSSCSTVRYITSVNYSQDLHNSLNYLSLSGGKTIEGALADMFTNTNDSLAKTTVEGWFEAENLDDIEDDLEDTVFCNDRTYYSGPLLGHNTNAWKTIGSFINETNEYYLDSVRQENYNRTVGMQLGDENGVGPLLYDVYDVNLNCSSKRDSFTKTETATTNGKLKHKVGLLTSDEILLANLAYSAFFANNNNYLHILAENDGVHYYEYDRMPIYTMSPVSFDSEGAKITYWNKFIRYYANAIPALALIRPVVSLKPGTEIKRIDGWANDGSKYSPYILKDND